MAHSLLEDPLLRVRFPDGTVEGFSLPQILCTLSQDNVLSFETLRAHQQQAWHSFLVQLAAMAVAPPRFDPLCARVSRVQHESEPFSSM